MRRVWENTTDGCPTGVSSLLRGGSTLPLNFIPRRLQCRGFPELPAALLDNTAAREGVSPAGLTACLLLRPGLGEAQGWL